MSKLVHSNGPKSRSHIAIAKYQLASVILISFSTDDSFCLFVQDGMGITVDHVILKADLHSTHTYRQTLRNCLKRMTDCNVSALLVTRPPQRLNPSNYIKYCLLTIRLILRRFGVKIVRQYQQIMHDVCVAIPPYWSSYCH
jgi:DNA-directed RNA polymerase subunit L